MKLTCPKPSRLYRGCNLISLIAGTAKSRHRKDLKLRRESAWDRTRFLQPRGPVASNGVPMVIPVPRLATKDDAAELIDLLCSASREIGLKGRVCRPENRSKLLKWMKGECEAQRVWTQTDGSTLQGMLILKESVSGILYVVVAECCRGRGIGHLLICHIQSRFGPPLDAEARNVRSQRMLERCGFRLTDESSSGYPILLWQG
jgi:hypothetical protein